MDPEIPEVRLKKLSDEFQKCLNFDKDDKHLTNLIINLHRILTYFCSYNTKIQEELKNEKKKSK